MRIASYYQGNINIFWKDTSIIKVLGSFKGAITGKRENQQSVSAIRWQHGSHMLCNFYLVKNHKIAKNSTTTKAREKISIDLESLKF